MQSLDCLGDVVEAPPPVLPSHDPFAPAVWMLSLLMLALIAFEVWALLTGHPTISQMLQHAMRGRTWLKVIGAIGVALLGWHLLWGFPW